MHDAVVLQLIDAVNRPTDAVREQSSWLQENAAASRQMSGILEDQSRYTDSLATSLRHLEQTTQDLNVTIRNTSAR